MSARVVNLLVLASFTGFLPGCSPEGMMVEEAGGFWTGCADGFLILVKFLAGQLGDPSFLKLQAGTYYDVGYLAGAMAFLSVGVLVSLPEQQT